MFDCDSVISQNLIVKTSVTTTLHPKYICSGDSILIFGEYRKFSGFYYDTLQSSTSYDCFLIQTLTVGNKIFIDLPDINICFGDSINIFGINRTDEGIFSDTTISANGCDSIINVKLNVIKIDTTIIINTDSLIAIQGADSYQWYNCSTNQLISGANKYYFIPSSNGKYKVKISKNNYESFSNCYQINTTSINKNEIKKIDFSIQPNPAKNKINLKYDISLNINKIEIFDIIGKPIYEKIISDKNENEIIISQLKEGYYFVKISNNNQSFTKKLIVNN